jgi:hypothetical protein
MTANRGKPFLRWAGPLSVSPAVTLWCFVRLARGWRSIQLAA